MSFWKEIAKDFKDVSIHSATSTIDRQQWLFIDDFLHVVSKLDHLYVI